MDFVDEEYVSRLEICDHGGEIARAVECGPRCAPERRSHLCGEDGCQAGLPQSWRAGEEDVIDWFVPCGCCLDQDRQSFLEIFLADELVQPSRSEPNLDRNIVLRYRGREKAVLPHVVRPFPSS